MGYRALVFEAAVLAALLPLAGAFEISEDGWAEAATLKELRDALYTPAVRTVTIKNNISINAAEWGRAVPNIRREVTVTTADDAPWPAILNVKSERELGFVQPGGKLVFQGVIFDEDHPQSNIYGHPTYFPLFTAFPGSKIVFRNCTMLQPRYICDDLGLGNMMRGRKPPQEVLDADEAIVYNASLQEGGSYGVLHEYAGPKEYLLYNDSAAQTEGWVYHFDTVYVCERWGLTSVERYKPPMRVVKKHFEIERIHELLNVVNRGDLSRISAQRNVSELDEEENMRRIEATVALRNDMHLTVRNWPKQVRIFFQLIRLVGTPQSEGESWRAAAVSFGTETDGKMSVEIARDASMELQNLDVKLPRFVPRHPLVSAVEKSTIQAPLVLPDAYHLR
eukprot:evm.model.scf_3800.1 EVM.evm.TU.scf_3800.1   scf_3800:1038-3521(-)